jgi:hypothetical protein
VVTDALSHPASPSTSVPSHSTPIAVVSATPAFLFPMPLSYLEIARKQTVCPSIPYLQQLSSHNTTSIPFTNSLSLLGDVFTNTFPFPSAAQFLTT